MGWPPQGRALLLCSIPLRDLGNWCWISKPWTSLNHCGVLARASSVSKSSTGQCLWRKCIKSPQGLRNQPLFFVIPELWHQQLLKSVSGACTSWAPWWWSCWNTDESLNIPLPESRTSFGAGLSLPGADGDVWAAPVAVPRAIPGVAAAIPGAEHQPGHLAGFAQVSRDNFLWESLCQLSALAWNNPSLRSHLLFVCIAGCTIKGREL